MKLSERLPGLLVLAIVVGGLGIIGWKFVAPAERTETVSVKVPAELSSLAQTGELAFNATCASCHGQNATGSDKGPPLVHDIYNPGHHSDEAFYLAAQRGVQQHHWPFGNMPPQPQVADDQLAAIVRYVRELQAANGIVYKPHRM